MYFDQPVGNDKSETVERESMTIQKFYFLIKQEIMNFSNKKKSKMERSNRVLHLIKLGKSDHFNLPEKLFNTIKPKFSNARESSQLLTKA